MGVKNATLEGEFEFEIRFRAWPTLSLQEQKQRLSIFPVEQLPQYLLRIQNLLINLNFLIYKMTLWITSNIIVKYRSVWTNLSANGSTVLIDKYRSFFASILVTNLTSNIRILSASNMYIWTKIPQNSAKWLANCVKKWTDFLTD